MEENSPTLYEGINLRAVGHSLQDTQIMSSREGNDRPFDYVDIFLAMTEEVVRIWHKRNRCVCFSDKGSAAVRGRKSCAR